MRGLGGGAHGRRGMPGGEGADGRTRLNAGGAGIVYLVGAGPGDPELITVRGLRCLRSAGVVVYDRLVDPRLLDEAPRHARRVYAGKRPGRQALRQEEINALLVRQARAGRTVVRLKGGDPFVFGRGAEEALACAAAGVACEVVPGLTSAAAVPAIAGIPLTHRGTAASFGVVTGHGAGAGHGGNRGDGGNGRDGGSSSGGMAKMGGLDGGGGGIAKMGDLDGSGGGMAEIGDLDGSGGSGGMGDSGDLDGGSGSGGMRDSGDLGAKGGPGGIGGAGGDAHDWGALARLDTLVVLMGAARLAEIAALLLRHGKPPDTPVAVIENGTLPNERVLTAPLAEVAEIAASAGAGSPATIVIGQVVRLRAELLPASRSFAVESQPLKAAKAAPSPG